MAFFRIDYADPETGERKSVKKEFHPFVGRAILDGVPIGEPMKITAREWACDYGYSLSDKGWHQVTEIPE